MISVTELWCLALMESERNHGFLSLFSRSFGKGLSAVYSSPFNAVLLPPLLCSFDCTPNVSASELERHVIHDWK